MKTTLLGGVKIELTDTDAICLSIEDIDGHKIQLDHFDTMVLTAALVHKTVAGIERDED